MPLEIITPNGTIVEGDPTFDALRVSQRPPECAGAYRYSAFTGLLPAALATAAPIFLLRNPDVNKKVILQYLKIRYAVITGFTAAQELGFDAVLFRNMQIPTAGGTQISAAGNNLKKNSAQAPSVVDARISGTAALTAPVGPAVIEANPILTGVAKTLATAATVQDIAFDEEYDGTNGSDYPIILHQFEGIMVRNSLVLGAAGTIRASITAAWLESSAYGG